MHCIIATLGSHGDMHPFLGIALKLRRRGLRVTVLAPAIFESLIASLKLDYLPMGTVAQFEEFAARPEIWHKRRGFKVVAEGTVSMLPIYYDAIARLHEPGQTILVLSSLALGGRIAQEKLGIPAVSVHLSPSLFRSVYQSPKFPPLPLAAWEPKWLKRMLFELADRLVIDRLLAGPVNQFRAQQGLPPVRSIFGEYLHSPQRVIGLFPEWFAPPQPDWPPQTILTGFPLYDERDVTPMPAELSRFLESGSAPIAFTPGSGMRHGQSFFAAAAEACQRLGRRGVLLSRHREHLPDRLPAEVLQVDFAPFSQLLPRCAALVHHCGIGTLSQALAAGIPQVAMPMAHDQPDNASRLQRLGVATVVPKSRFNATSLAIALSQALTSRSIQQSCRQIAQKFSGEDPLEQTARIIEAAAVTAGERSTTRSAGASR